MAEKSFYWIKLRTDFFDSDTVDFLMSQTNGANYVVLYQMLCLKTTSTEGGLYSEMGEIVVPYNVEKIARLTKYFDVDTIRVALELYKKLGLVYVQEDGILKITGYGDLVGCSKTDDHTRKLTAIRQQRYRERQRSVTVTQQVTEDITSPRNAEIEIELRDKSEEIDMSGTTLVKKENFKEKKRFVKPSLEEAKAYAEEKNYSFSVEQWFAYYEANGWKVGKNPMKSWKACMAYWNGNNNGKATVKSNSDDVDHGFNPLIDRVDNDEEEGPW